MTSSRTPSQSTAGFSLVEMMTAMLITVVAIMGLAHTFGLGVGFIDRYASARSALARANGQIEHVRAQVRSGSPLGNADSVSAIVLSPGLPGQIHTVITAEDDPADGLDGSTDYFNVSAAVSWTQGGVTDSVRIVTLIVPS